ncbi:hypothetical protein DPMN_121371 [Dreissena polymorpha]|uniref:Uncharacterized protein n=1 Tax=Dreissena polymorpha TaxID=45954 RepID=A0A9D4GTF2_DREPO|nr:hypothetical protein DPMN_121371 [Dreissena polymorpha]
MQIVENSNSGHIMKTEATKDATAAVESYPSTASIQVPVKANVEDELSGVPVEGKRQR